MKEKNRSSHSQNRYFKANAEELVKIEENTSTKNGTETPKEATQVIDNSAEG